MDFLKRIYNKLRRRESKDFRKSISEEKEQKYLFERKSSIQRNKKDSLFSKNRKGKNVLNAYSSFVQNSKILAGENILSKQIIGWIGALLLLLSIYIVFFSPYLRVSPSHVLVEATTPWLDINIAYRTLEDIYGDNLLFLDEEEVAYSLKEALQNLGHIQIDKLYPNGIKIIMEWTPIKYTTYIAGVQNKFWYMSENGVLIPSDTDNIGTGSLIEMRISSDSLRNELFLDYKQWIDEGMSYLISKIITLLEKEMPELRLKKLYYLYAEQELHIELQNGTKILMILTDENAVEWSKSKDGLEYIKTELIGLKNFHETNKNALINGSIRYIDIRIKNKLFICKEDALCKKNLINIYWQIYAE